MKVVQSRILFVGIMVLSIPSMHCIDYEVVCKSLFLNNKTNHRLIISFCNDAGWEQQQFVIEPQEERAVRVSAQMLQKMGSVKVVFGDRKKKKKKKCKRGRAAEQETQPQKRQKVSEEQEVPMQAQSQIKELGYDRTEGIVGLEMAIISGDLDLKWRYSNEYRKEEQTL